MNLKQNPFTILTEAVKSESFKCCDLEDDQNNIDDELIQGEFEDIYDGVEELEENVGYTEEIVTVVQQESTSGIRNLVELYDLARYMESANISDIGEAVTKIAECNSLAADTMCVVIESNDYAQEMLNEAKRLPAKIKSKDIKDSSDVIKLMKTKGIKVLKKKSKSKRKKK